MCIHKRKTSIQIDGLLHELKTNFADLSALNNNRKISLPIEKNRIATDDFKIFTIMDTDDCSNPEKYITGALFDQYKLKDYVVPIYNKDNLEQILYSCGLIPKIFNDSEKVKEYGKLFPISRTPLGKSGSKINDMQTMANILRENRNTNMEKLLDYFIELSIKRQVSNFSMQ